MSRDLLSLNLFGTPALSCTAGPVAISPGAAMVAAYLALVDSLPEFQHVIVPVGKGLSIAYRRG